jgi:predicted TIM-barrel fold metal-dependent hydrolase
MPSNHSKWHSDYFDMPDYPQLGRRRAQLPGPGVTVLDEDGQLKPEVLTIVELVAQNDVCLATGHLSLEEIRALQDAVTVHGDVKFVVTHANWALSRLDVETQRELMSKGAYIEYVASSCVSLDFMEQEPAELGSWINEFEGERLVFGSDLGQFGGPPHPEGLRMLLSSLLAAGVKYSYLERMLKENPATLLGLDG